MDNVTVKRKQGILLNLWYTLRQIKEFSDLNGIDYWYDSCSYDDNDNNELEGATIHFKDGGYIFLYTTGLSDYQMVLKVINSVNGVREYPNKTLNEEIESLEKRLEDESDNMWKDKTALREWSQILLWLKELRELKTSNDNEPLRVKPHFIQVGSQTYQWHTCPTCGAAIEIDSDGHYKPFCCQCGQALDWDT